MRFALFILENIMKEKIQKSKLSTLKSIIVEETKDVALKSVFFLAVTGTLAPVIKSTIVFTNPIEVSLVVKLGSPIRSASQKRPSKTSLAETVLRDTVRASNVLTFENNESQLPETSLAERWEKQNGQEFKITDIQSIVVDDTNFIGADQLPSVVVPP